MTVKKRELSRKKTLKQKPQNPKSRSSNIVDSDRNLLMEPFPDLEYDSYETEDLDGLIRLVTFHVGKAKGYGAFLLPTLNRAFLKAASGIEERVRFARSALFRLCDFDSSWTVSKSQSQGFNIARNMQLAIGENLHQMLKSVGKPRISEAKKIKALLCDAVDQLAVGEEWKYPANKEIVDFHGRPLALDHADLPGSKGWINISELPSQTHFPLACIAIEITRQLTARMRRLPTKKEVKTEILNSYPKVKTSMSVRRTATLSAAMWSKIWQEAGLKILKRDGSW